MFAFMRNPATLIRRGMAYVGREVKGPRPTGLIVGTPGSGWTSVPSALHGSPNEGRRAVMLNPKSDRALSNEVVALANLDSGSSPVDNPYVDKSEDAIADMLLAGEDFASLYYRAQAQRYIRLAVRVLRAVGSTVSPLLLARYLNPHHLGVLVGGLGGSQVGEDTQVFLDSLTRDEKACIASIGSRLSRAIEHDS
jgi:hypothetical protein